eukprot:SAG31_NODE_872_length_11329_cov_3.968655_9_plen_74_part_00
MAVAVQQFWLCSAQWVPKDDCPQDGFHLVRPHDEARPVEKIQLELHFKVGAIADPTRGAGLKCACNSHTMCDY